MTTINQNNRAMMGNVANAGAVGGAEGMTVKVKPSLVAADNKTYRLAIIADSFKVDWGDGVVDSNMVHTYANGDSEYTVQVTGTNITKLSQDVPILSNGYGYGYALTALLRMNLPNLNNTDNMFGDARNIHDWSNLALPARLTSIGAYAFRNCSNLSLTSLPAGLTSIKFGAFAYCSNLALTSLPEELTDIWGDAFSNCSNLALTSLPEGLTSIGDWAFKDCLSLALTSLPAGLTSIGRYTFLNCPSLALTSLPEGLTSIGDYAFEDCFRLALTSLPEGVTSIGNYAFWNCTSLASVVFLGTPNRIGRNAFRGTSANLFVPWPNGAVANAPWGTQGIITYGYIAKGEAQ